MKGRDNSMNNHLETQIVDFDICENKAVAKVWNREYIWEDSLLPTKIKTAGVDILSAPASIHAHFNGTELPFADTKYFLIEKTEDKAVFVVAQTAGNIIINAKFTIEEDGLLDWEMSVIPYWQFAPDEGRMPKLNRLYFEFPIKKEYAGLFHYWPNGNSGIMPDHSGVSCGAVPKGGADYPFKPYFFVGWEFGGLCVCTETDENMELLDKNQCIQLIEADDSLIMRWNLLNQIPKKWQGREDVWTETLAPIDYKFGIQATPVRELPADRMENYRIFHFGYGPGGPYSLEDVLKLNPETGLNLLDEVQKAGGNWILFHEFWSAMQNYGYAVDELLFQTIVEECHKRNLKVMVYFGYEYSTLAPEWQEKKEDYLLKAPSGNYNGGWQRNNPYQRAYIACYKGGYAEEMRNRVAFVMEHYHVDGIYTDGTFIPWECANEVHGCGYNDCQGNRQFTFPVFAVRNHVKKLYELVHNHEGILDTHQSACLMAPLVSYCDSYYDGENIQGKLMDGGMDFLGFDAFRAEFMGKNMGLISQFLAKNNEDSFTIEQIVSVTALHDILPRPCNVTALRYVGKWWDILSEFGIGNATWHPYWEKNLPIKANEEKVFCSTYEKNGETLAVISCFDKNRNKITLTADKTIKEAQCLTGGEILSFEGNFISVRVSGREAAALHIKFQ